MAIIDHWPSASDWQQHVGAFLQSEAFKSLAIFVDQERQSHTIFPPQEDVFNAFRWTSFEQTKVVIIGQDPYHGPGQAHGLSFSVSGETKIPPSLRNIYKELVSDIGCNQPAHGNLESWARQGVLLLNTVLTVRCGQANSHQKKGWEQFTQHIVGAINQRDRPAVFILWGKPAEKRAASIADRHVKIISPHPSPLSAHRGFFGSKPFSKTNQALKTFQQAGINWAIE